MDEPRRRVGATTGAFLPPHPRQQRRKPSQGVLIHIGQPTIVLVTVCTKDRLPWLACEEAHSLLVRVWSQADAWLVGRYTLMPDHLHLFAGPRDLRFPAERWIAFWKRRFSSAHDHSDWNWQPSSFHHRLRSALDFEEKSNYVRQNPVRAGLVEESARWPYQGVIHEMRW